MKSITVIRKKNVVEAIEYISMTIEARHTGFFVDTEFGKIGVEVVHHDSVISICRWDVADETRFVVRNKLNNISCDYYLSIPKSITPFMSITEYGIAMELYKTMVLKLFSGKEVIRLDMMTIIPELAAYSYMAMYSGYPITEIESEYVKYSAPVSTSRTRRTLHNIINSKFAGARYKLAEIEKKYSSSTSGIISPHVVDVLGLLLYAVKADADISKVIHDAPEDNLYDFLDTVICKVRS